MGQHASFVQRNFSQGTHLASASGLRTGGNLNAGHFSGATLHNANLSRAGSGAFAHNLNANHSFNNNINHNFNNTRWSGGWNRWQNRSFFFGLGTPFGAFNRGFYPWYGYGYRRFGFGLGFYPYYYGYGYPYYYGYGYGYPYYYGYPAYSYGSYLNCYSNYGYGGYGGYGSYGNGYPAYGYDGSGYAAAYPATVGDSSGAPATYAAQYPPVTDAASAPGPSTPVGEAPLPADTASGAAPSVDDITAADFAGQGELDFKAGKYESAARNFRHALVDDPSNAGVLLLLGQAMFALGQYDEAAGATATAMQSLPQDKWGAVVENYQQLYGNPADYVNQLRALQKARDAKPDSPALQFLLGFQSGYHGDLQQALRALDKTVQLEPKDAMAKTLRDLLAKKAGATGPVPAAANKPVAPSPGSEF